MLAALGGLAVLRPALLLRTPITQHPSGAGSSEQVFQEALTTYRYLAQAHPQTALPQVALVLQHLGLLYRATQRFSEGERAFQEALTTYRQLAQAQPQTYFPQVAMTLQNLGMLHVDQEDIQQAQTLITEALIIRRALRKSRAGADGHDLAQSLAVESMMPHRQEEAVTLICERLHAIAKEARRKNLKPWAQGRTGKVCKRGP
jgi:tetratricopeptide (TPR) repeat protein